MNQNKIFKYGFFALLVIAILAYVFKGVPSETKAYIKKIEEEKTELKDNVSRLEGNIRNITTELELKTDSLVFEREISINAKKQTLSAIRYYEKRIKTRDNLAVHDLDSIFANRFGSGPTEVDGH